jgi:hypothetical protein
MSTYHLIGYFLAILFPLLPGMVAVALLRRCIKATKTPWFSLSASAMVFGLSTIWLTKSGSLVIASVLGPAGALEAANAPEWVETVYRAGPPMSISLVVLSGGFWLYLKIRKI